MTSEVIFSIQWAFVFLFAAGVAVGLAAERWMISIMSLVLMLIVLGHLDLRWMT
ncbi:MAG TPA: hypothetical protein VNZ94_00385 [Xanthobacteraceae bacterium]|nr:hypothetical protein [Xanthobacteraceae bacterium]